MINENEEVNTKDRILYVSEELFAENGYHATSIRDITRRAGVHIGSVNYHFSSKEGLFQAVISRKISKINEERLILLKESGESVEEVLRAFLSPALHFSQEGNSSFMRLMGRLYVEPGEFWKPVFELFEDVVKAFSGALARALPHLSETELVWRFHFMIGSMCHVLMDTQGIGFLSGDKIDSKDTDLILNEMVAFSAAGFRS